MTFQHLTSLGLVAVLAWPLGLGARHDFDPSVGADGSMAEGSSDSAVAVSADPTVIAVGGDADDHRRLGEALRSFRNERLELPDVDVHFHDDDPPCRGHLGLFQPSFTPWRILVCSDLEFVPTHELAHAWEAANVDDDLRTAYLDRHDLETWSSTSVEWRDRGVEHAAFCIQQNLMASTPNLDSPAWQERMTAYELLTGRASPLRRTAEVSAALET